jgi:hypothetical protein
MVRELCKQCNNFYSLEIILMVLGNGEKYRRKSAKYQYNQREYGIKMRESVLWTNVAKNWVSLTINLPLQGNNFFFLRRGRT